MELNETMQECMQKIVEDCLRDCDDLQSEDMESQLSVGNAISLIDSPGRRPDSGRKSITFFSRVDNPLVKSTQGMN